MTIDELIALAHACADTKRYATLDECRGLADGVLALLATEQPCGWDVPVVLPSDNAIVWEMIEFTADEARWAARALLQAADRLDKDQG